MKRPQLIYATVLVVLVAIVALSTMLAPAPSSSIPSVSNPGPRGLMALRLLLQQLPGFEVELQQGPNFEPEQLDAELLVVTEPAARAYSSDEVETLLARVAAGSRLVVLLSASEGELAVGLKPLLKTLQLRGRDLLPCETSPVEPRGILAGLEHPLRDIGHVIAESPPEVQRLLSCEQGGVLLSRAHGRGLILVLSQLELLDNAHLGKPGHARLAINLLAPVGISRVLFEESHHHALRQVGVGGLLRRPPFAGAIGVLLVVCLLYVWARSPRRGGVRPTPRLIGAEVEPTVRGLARLYRDSDDVEGLWRRVLELAEQAGVDVADPGTPNSLKQLGVRASAVLQAVDGQRPASGRSGPLRTR